MTNIKEILQDLGYTIHSEGTTNYSCRPLYRQSNNNTALSVCKKTGNYFDFVEGRGNSLENLIKRTLNFEEDGQVEEWLKNKSFQISPEDPKPILKMPKKFDEIFTLPHNYWIEKGISHATLDFFNAKGVAHSESMNKRYVFPIPEESGSLIGFAGRLVVPIPKKDSGKIGKWKLIGGKRNWCYPYYFNRLNILESKEVILCESLGDMLALFESGFKNTLVLFGTSIFSPILTKLIEIDPRRIIVATNNDLENSGAGNRAADEVISKLSKFFDSKRLFNGVPTSHNDLMDLFEKEGQEGIRGWYDGLFLE